MTEEQETSLEAIEQEYGRGFIYFAIEHLYRLEQSERD